MKSFFLVLLIVCVIGLAGFGYYDMKVRNKALSAVSKQTNEEVSKIAEALGKVEGDVTKVSGNFEKFLRLEEEEAQKRIAAAEAQKKLPFIEIKVDEKYQITRTVLPDEESLKLTWNIYRDGKKVQGRNAANESAFTYFANRPGIYTVYVTGSIDGTYRVVSNVVFYEVEEK